MSNLNSKLLTSGAVGAVLMAASFVAPAQAQPSAALYGGGATSSEKIYRDIMNCYGATSNYASGDQGTTANLQGHATGCNTVAAYNPAVELLYVGVGSGNGKKAFVNHNAADYISTSAPDNPPVPSTVDFGPFYGTGTGVNWVGSATSGNNFPNVSFSGSDDPLTTSDVATFQTNSAGNWGGANSGNLDLPNQFPTFITVISVPFHPTVFWNPKGSTVSGSSSKVNFLTNTLCGIFTGVISNWNDPAFESANGSQTLGSGKILVTYRGDGSGATFLFTNALIHQCGTQTNPRAGITNSVPDKWLADNGIENDAGGIGASNDSFFVNVVSHGDIPSNFTPSTGSGGVKAYVNANIGAVGYVSPDFAQPVDASGPVAANLQTSASVGGTAKFLAPTGTNGAKIVASTNLPPSKQANSCTVATSYAVGTSPDGVCQDNPFNWGVAFPQPVSTSAYPIGGFAFIDTYKCYASATDAANLASTKAGKLGYFRWYFGSTTENASHVKTELINNGVAEIPGTWISAIKALLTTNAPTKIEAAGSAGKCLHATGA